MAKLGFASFGKRTVLNAGGHVVRKSDTGEELTVEEQHSKFRSQVEVEAPQGAEDSEEDSDFEDEPPEATSSNADGRGSGTATNPLGLPLTHNIELKGHPKAVGAMALDRSGSRLITGGWDHMLRFWNFAGMTNSLRFFHEFDPMGEYHGAYIFNQIQFTADGSKFVLCRAHPQPLLFSREGKELFEFAKGDMYVAEMLYTKGHTAEVTGCQFSPIDPQLLLTGAKDSTVRLWDLDRVQYRNTEVIKTAQGLAKGRKAPVTCCSWSADGLSILAGTDGGAVMVWPGKGPFKKPAQQATGCHANQTNITSLASGPGHHVVSRGDDGTAKVWDLRKFGSPISTLSGLETIYEHCDVLYSPDQRYIVTGTSTPKNSPERAKVVVFDATTFARVAAVPMPPGCSVLRLLWHPELNQLLVGCSDGVCRVYYDPHLSRKGALLCATKQKKGEPMVDLLGHAIVGDVKTPHALPMFREDSSKGVRRRYRQAFAPDASGIPTKFEEELAVTRISTKHEMMKQAGIAKNTIRSEDPVAALRAMAKEAQEQPLYVAPMYAKTQPKPVFAEPEVEFHPIHGSAEEQAAKKRRRLEELRASGANVRIT
eukprot:EG_transcript_5786